MAKIKAVTRADSGAATVSAIPKFLEITNDKKGIYSMRFDNPWINKQLWLRPEDGRYLPHQVRKGGDTADVRGCRPSAAHDGRTHSAARGVRLGQ